MSTNSVSNINENIKTFNSIALDDDILQMYLKDVGKTKMINHQEENLLQKEILQNHKRLSKNLLMQTLDL